MATNFADLAAVYWGRMRHWQKAVDRRDIFLAQLASQQFDKRYARRKVSQAEADRAMEAIEAELVDTDRRRSVLIGRQQFNQRMHDSCVLEALMRGHRPSAELVVELDEVANRVLTQLPQQTARLYSEPDTFRREWLDQADRASQP